MTGGVHIYVPSVIEILNLCLMMDSGRQPLKIFLGGGADPGAESATAAAVVKPYQFRMSEVEGFRYRVTVSEFD